MAGSFCLEFTDRSSPVVAVEVVEPAALLDELDGAGAVPPGGVAVRAFVGLALAALHSALVRLLHLEVHVVVHTLPGVRLPMARAWSTTHSSLTPGKTQEELLWFEREIKATPQTDVF